MNLLYYEDMSAEINDHLHKGVVGKAVSNIGEPLRWNTIWDTIRKPIGDNVGIVQRWILQELNLRI